MAIASLVLGILSLVCSFVCLGLVLGPVAAILGFISRQRISSSGGAVGGGTLAIVGMVLGVIGFIASAGFVILVAVTGALSQSGASPSP